MMNTSQGSLLLNHQPRNIEEAEIDAGSPFLLGSFILILFLIMPSFLIGDDTILEGYMDELNKPTDGWGNSLSEPGAYHISQYNGELSMKVVDLSIPGRAGLDLVIKRLYSSKIYNDQENLQYNDKGPLGVGWDINFGVLKAFTDEYITFEYTDPLGSSSEFVETDDLDATGRNIAFSTNYDRLHIDYGDPLSDNIVVYSKDGTRMDFDHYVDTTYNGSHTGLPRAYNYVGFYCTKITDTNGNQISINYLTKKPHIDYVTDTKGDVYDFEYDTDGFLDKITRQADNFVLVDYAIGNSMLTKVLTDVVYANNQDIEYDYCTDVNYRAALDYVKNQYGGEYNFLYDEITYTDYSESGTPDRDYIAVISAEHVNVDATSLIEFTYQYSQQTTEPYLTIVTITNDQNSAVEKIYSEPPLKYFPAASKAGRTRKHEILDGTTLIKRIDSEWTSVYLGYHVSQGLETLNLVHIPFLKTQVTTEGDFSSATVYEYMDDDYFGATIAVPLGYTTDDKYFNETGKGNLDIVSHYGEVSNIVIDEDPPGGLDNAMEITFTDVVTTDNKYISYDYKHIATSAYLDLNIVDRQTNVGIYSSHSCLSQYLISKSENQYDETGHNDYIEYTDASQHTAPTIVQRGNITSTKRYLDASNNVESNYYYDNCGNVVRTLDAGDAETTTDYTYSGDADYYEYAYPVTITQNANNATQSFEYNIYTGDVESVTDANSNQTEFIYDDRSRPLKVIKSGDSETYPTLNIVYDDSNNKLAYTFRKSSTEIFTPDYVFYNGFGKVDQIQTFSDEENKTIMRAVQYDGMGRIAKSYTPYFDADTVSDTKIVLDITEHHKSYTYDGLSRVTTTVNEDTTDSDLDYDGDKTTFTDENDHILETIKDAFGNKIEFTQIDNNVDHTTVFNYNRINDLTSIVNPENQTITFAPNMLGWVTQTDHPDNGIHDYEFNNMGQVTAHRTEMYADNHYYIKNVYDDLHRLTNEQIQNYTYVVENDIIVEDFENQSSNGWTSSQISGLGVLITASIVTDEYNGAYALNFNYSVAKFLTSLRIEKTFTTAEDWSSYSPGIFSLAIKCTQSLAQNELTLKVYDSNNSLLGSSTNGQATSPSQWHIQGIGIADRDDIKKVEIIVNHIFPKGSANNITIDYATVSNDITYGTTTNENKLSYHYDNYDFDGNGSSDVTIPTGLDNSLNQVTRSDNAAEIRTMFYDERNQISQEDVDIVGLTGGTRSLEYEYDKKGNLTKVIYPDQTYVSYQYTDTDRLEWAKYHDGTTLNTIADFSYEADGQPDLIEYGNLKWLNYNYSNRSWIDAMFTNTGVDVEIHYDGVGNITYIEDIADGTNDQAFTYDNLDRLDSAICSDWSSSRSYTYDKVGNFNNYHGSTFSYISGTNKLSSDGTKSYQYDELGNITNRTWGSYYEEFTYDYRNLTTQIKMLSGSFPKYLNFTYNSQDQRVKKQYRYYETYNIKGFPIYEYDTHYYLYGLPGMLVEYNSDGSMNNKYIFANGKRIARVNSFDQIHYFVPDHLGGTRQLLSETGSVTFSAKYYPFGALWESSGSLVKYRFTGHEFDTESDLYNAGYRNYDPEIGRWLAVDPLWDLSPEHSPYNYVKNNPLIFIDPTGLIWEFSQSTGTFTHYDDETNEITQTIEGGYSGVGDGWKNPEAEHIPFVGPTPLGNYEIQPPRDADGLDPEVKDYSMKLEPDEETRDHINTIGREPDTFYIHGDNIDQNNTGSSGCPVISPRAKRVSIWESGDTYLRVVK